MGRQTILGFDHDHPLVVLLCQREGRGEPDYTTAYYDDICHGIPCVAGECRVVAAAKATAPDRARSVLQKPQRIQGRLWVGQAR
jgi:hypothetical protein